MTYRTRPVHQTMVAAAEDVEWLIERGDDFIRRQYVTLSPYNHPEAYTALLDTYVSTAMRHVTKAA